MSHGNRRSKRFLFSFQDCWISLGFHLLVWVLGQRTIFIIYYTIKALFHALPETENIFVGCQNKYSVSTVEATSCLPVCPGKLTPLTFLQPVRLNTLIEFCCSWSPRGINAADLNTLKCFYGSMRIWASCDLALRGLSRTESGDVCEKGFSSCASASLGKRFCCAGLLSTRWPRYKAISGITAVPQWAFVMTRRWKDVHRRMTPGLFNELLITVKSRINRTWEMFVSLLHGLCWPGMSESFI